jgi:transposase
MEEKDEDGAMRRLWSRDLRNILSAVKDGSFKYEGKEKKSINWRSYNEAQLNELADMLKMIRYSVGIAAERIRTREPNETKRGPGRPPIPYEDVAKVLLLQSYFGVSDRVAGGLLKVFDTKLGISETFSYKTIERGYDPERTKLIFDEIFKLTNEWSNFVEDTFGTDGTGDPVTNKVNYESKRSDQRKELEKKEKGRNKQDINASWPSKKHDFQYDVISAGMHTKIIAGFSTTGDHHVGELTQFPCVMEQTSKNAPSMAIMLGDRLYANRPTCKLVSSYGVALYSLPKSNSTLRSHGVFDWKRMMYEFILDPQGFLGVYHGRSISETVNSMMKRREPTPIRKRLSWRKSTEEGLKVYIHNLRQSCYLTYLAPELTRTPLHAS